MWVVITPAIAQLFLITGSPNPKGNETFAVELFRIDTDKSIHDLANLVPVEIGTEWIAVSYEWRKAVILESATADRNEIIVVDLNSPGIIKQCTEPPALGSLISEWLADVPNLGQSYVEFLTSDPEKGVVRAMVLDPSVACDLSFKDVDAYAIRYIVATGTSGVADVGAQEGTYAGIDSKGDLKRFLAGVLVDIGYQIPSTFLPVDGTGIIANTRQVLVLGMHYEKTGDRGLVFRKSDKSWVLLPFCGHIRAFGNFIAVAESRDRHAGAEENAGKAEWRKKSVASGPNMNDRLRDYAFGVFPGRLHIYDVNTGKTYTITTNQADSEILLIENSTVYYRVTNRLYAAEITKMGLDSARLLATAEAVRDAHWAFLKH